MNLLRPAGLRRWRRTFLLAACAAVALPVSAAPSSAKTARLAASAPKFKRKEAPAKSAAEPASAVGIGEFADAYPSEIRRTPADLVLKAENERKAGAFSAFAQGLLAEDERDQDKMLEGYRKTLEFDPGYAELAVKVAYELARRNNPSEGVQILKDAIKAAPKEPLPYIYLSQLYARYLKKPDLAEKYAQEAVALAPANFAAYLALYELHVGNGQNKKAEQVLERATKVDTKEAKFWIQLGNLYRRLYLKEDGSCTPEELKKMNAVHLKAAELGPTDAAIVTEVADYFVLSKQVKEAIPYYLAVLALPQEAGDPQVVNVRDKLARSLIVTDQRDAAISVLEQIIKDNSLRFETYELLGELYEQRAESERIAGDTAKADVSLQRALDHYQHTLLLDASQPRNHLRLAELMIRMKQPGKAVETMQAANEKFPDVPAIKYILAIALSQAKRHTDALAAFAEAKVDAEASHEELLNADFYFNYGAAAEQAGLLDKAADLLKQSIELDASIAKAYNYLGYMWADRGEHLEEAGGFIKKANELDPDNGAYLDSLGWYYLKKGEPEKALKELLHAAENIRREEKKDDAVVLDHIGDAYARLGKTAEAMEYWKKAAAIGLDDKKTAEKIAEKIDEAKQKLAKGDAATGDAAIGAPPRN